MDSQPNSTKYFQKMLQLPPEMLCGMQNSHIMFLYFILHGLDINKIQVKSDERIQLLKYINSLILKYDHIDQKTGQKIRCSGFLPSSIYTRYQINSIVRPHIIFTYSALNCLAILSALPLSSGESEGQDQKMLVKEIVESVRSCGRADGSFANFPDSNEADLRFVYAATAICGLLGDFSPINIPLTESYIQRCLNLDGGYGLCPMRESHSGAIYCAISALRLLGSSIKNPQLTLNWLVNRQTTSSFEAELYGVQGRLGKLPDSCYTFWVGASIQLLTGQSLLERGVVNFLKFCQTEKGSYSKYPQSQGDLLHTLHSNSGLQILSGRGDLLALERGLTLRAWGNVHSHSKLSTMI